MQTQAGAEVLGTEHSLPNEVILDLQPQILNLSNFSPRNIIAIIR